MFLLLLAAVAIYLVLGDVREALVLAASMLAVIGIAVYQQHRTERALEALRDLSSPRALVIRDGVEKRIPGREVVRGDVVLLREGDRVPADGLLRAAVELAVDESLLTGESLPGRQERRSRRAADGTSGRSDRRGVFRHAGGARPRRRGSSRHRSAQRNRTDRQRARSRSNPKRRLCSGRRAGWCNGSRWPGSRCARSSRSRTACCAVIGPRRSWPASRWRWEYCPRNFPVVLTVFFALGAWRISKRQRAHPPDAGDRDARRDHGACVSTRPARSPRIACRSLGCGRTV